MLGRGKNWGMVLYPNQKEDTVKSENEPRGLYFSKALFEELIFGGAYIRSGLCMVENLRFKIDWASL